MTIPPQAQFPDKNTLAQALFGEGVRHLEDAQVLHNAQRYPAAIASAMKAAELGVKTMVVLDGALGWWDKIFTTHTPLSDIKAVDFFRHHVNKLESYSRTLVADVEEMERLAPTRPGAQRYQVEREKNPEYPFLSYTAVFSADMGQFRLDTPSSFFTKDDSYKYSNTAQELLNAITTQYTDVAQWQLTLPKSL